MKVYGSNDAVTLQIGEIPQAIGGPQLPIDNFTGGGGAVDSVNGQTGEVVLDADDVGAVAPGDDISELTNDSNFISSDNTGIGVLTNIEPTGLDSYAGWAAIPIGTMFQPGATGRTFLNSNVDPALPPPFDAFLAPANCVMVKLPNHASTPTTLRFLLFGVSVGVVSSNYGNQYFIQITNAPLVCPDQLISMESYYTNAVPWLLPAYSVATLPTAADSTGRIIRVVDDVAGVPVIALCDGTNWLRAYDNAPVSTT